MTLAGIKKLAIFGLAFFLGVVGTLERAWAQAATSTPTPTLTCCPSNYLNWNLMATMPTARGRLATGVVNGILYAVGGQNTSGDAVTNLEAYNPATNSWSEMAPMPTGREDLAVEVVNGILYAVGGYNGTNVLSTVEAYNPATNSWSTMAPLTNARCNLSAGVVNGILYAVGGDDTNGNPLGTVEAYNPGTNSWSPMASMPTARSQLSVGVVNGILYAAGGNTSVGFTSPGTIVGTLEAYNPGTNSWTTGLAPMITGRECTSGGVMNCLFYVAGGFIESGPVNTVEAYNPSTNIWSTPAAMPDSLANVAGEAINGVLYVVGGWSGSMFMNSNQAGTLVCEATTPAATSTPTPSASGDFFIYPSPARGNQAAVSYNMAQSGQVDLRIWNEKAEIVTHVTDSKPAGVQVTPFSIVGFGTGVYFYSLTITYVTGQIEKMGPKKFAILH